MRTQGYIEVLGRELQNHPRFCESLSHARLRQIVQAAPLHDIGKIGIPDAILLKPGPLTREEFEIMKTHAALGGNALNRAMGEAGNEMRTAQARMAPTTGAEDPLEFLQVARDIAQGHHEKWDGSGYPAGLSGDAIPVGARLMALADVFDALISRRVYKPAFPADEVRRIIVQGRGSQFDPDIVDAFLARLDDFLEIASRYRDEPEAG
ncbi:MAG: HD domain-containing protein [Burkholderiaceae bacterium]|nr:HD domain-containing protein [Burkholderiaceae bacterium]